MVNTVRTIAILGATSHIAKNLIKGLSDKGVYCLYLFARDLKSVTDFIEQHIDKKQNVYTGVLKDFENHEYDVIINCIGIGDPAKLRTVGAGIFTLTEQYDNLILSYLYNRDALYINFSSGAAYGSNFSNPADQNTMALININSLSLQDYYSISKISTEAKHRAHKNLNIVDLRVFGFFSRYIDLGTPYFLNDVINSIGGNKKLITGSNDMIRDYVHPTDLLQLVEKCMEMDPINDVFDVYSTKYATKFEIIEYCIQNFGLKCEIEDDINIVSPTGAKSNYFSLNKHAEIIGYIPEYSSMDTIISEFIVLRK